MDKKKRKTSALTMQSPVQLSIDELQKQFVTLCEHTRSLGLKPMAATTTLEIDGVYCGSVLVLYCAESQSDVNGKQHIPLMPYFYPAEVASGLEVAGILQPEHTTKRSGVLTTWCTISETFV